MQQVVTQQAVDAASDAIVAAGGKPTFRLIQQRVGGSFTTLKPMLADWEGRREKGDVQREAMLAGQGFGRDGQRMGTDRLLRRGDRNEFWRGGARVPFYTYWVKRHARCKR